MFCVTLGEREAGAILSELVPMPGKAWVRRLAQDLKEGEGRMEWDEEGGP